MPSEPKTITLKHPVQFGSTLISELTFRRPKLGDIRSISLRNQTVGDLIDAAGKICGQTNVVMDEIDPEDAVAIAALVADFFPGLLTGLSQ